MARGRHGLTSEEKNRNRVVGGHLKELREKAGINQKQLADLLGIGYYTFVSQVENGYAKLPATHLTAWAAGVKADPEELSMFLIQHYLPTYYLCLRDAFRIVREARGR